MLLTALAVFSIAAFPLAALAQQKEIKIGFIYDLTGPFANSGSEAAQIGTKAAIDMFNERGGVEGYRINAIFVDAQSKVDVAINEMTRLIDQEKVDILSGLFSSAECMPIAPRADARKKFTWINVCVATEVLKGRNLNYVFRPHQQTDLPGAMSCDYINYYASPSSASSRRISRWRSSTRTAPMASASPRAASRGARSTACRSC
jgi:branched-chain amino acid transport system substrate-binding protein